VCRALLVSNFKLLRELSKTEKCWSRGITSKCWPGREGEITVAANLPPISRVKVSLLASAYYGNEIVLAVLATFWPAYKTHALIDLIHWHALLQLCIS
jgi:hypothetical protein